MYLHFRRLCASCLLETSHDVVNEHFNIMSPWEVGSIVLLVKVARVVSSKSAIRTVLFWNEMFNRPPASRLIHGTPFMMSQAFAFDFKTLSVITFILSINLSRSLNKEVWWGSLHLKWSVGNVDEILNKM